VPPGQVALANAPIASDREAGGLREVVFAEIEADAQLPGGLRRRSPST
jgi:hypothetical protein